MRVMPDHFFALEMLHKFKLRPLPVTPNPYYNNLLIPEQERAKVCFITADVCALYPGIEINKALDGIRAEVHECVKIGACSPETRTPIMLIAQLVFTTMHVKYKGTCYKQKWGFPMASSLSPVAANFYMGNIEDLTGEPHRSNSPVKDLLPIPHNNLRVFRRLIVDYFMLTTNCTMATMSLSTSHRCGLGNITGRYHYRPVFSVSIHY